MERLQSIFESKEVKFGDTTNSEDFNEMNQEIGFDIYNALDNITHNRNLINENIDLMQLNNHFLNQKINNIEEALKYLEEGVEYIDFHNNELLSYGEDLPVYDILDENKATISNMYNFSILNTIRQKPKTFVTDIHGEEFFVPDDLNIEVEDNIDGDFDIIDSGLNKAFDQDITTAWTRKVIMPEGNNTNSVKTTMNIKLPKSIISNMSANTLYINPYPERNVDVLDILYKPINGSDFISFKDRGIFEAKNNSKNIALVFNEIQPTEIKIVFKQDNPIVVDNGNKKMFVTGAQNIALYNNYFSDNGMFYAHFKPSGPIKRIEDIIPKFSNIDDYSDAFEFTIYGVNKNIDSFVEVITDQDISNNHNDNFWIKINLKKSDNVASPVLKGLVVKYQNL